jgi:hypothetical protein
MILFGYLPTKNLFATLQNSWYKLPTNKEEDIVFEIVILTILKLLDKGWDYSITRQMTRSHP